MADRSLEIDVHHEDGGFWAEVREWPGCLATGRSLDELAEALLEAIALYVAPEQASPPTVRVQVTELRLSIESSGPLEPARSEAFAGRLPPPRIRDPHARRRRRPPD